jgi:hypothetical protein
VPVRVGKLRPIRVDVVGHSRTSSFGLGR